MTTNRNAHGRRSNGILRAQILAAIMETPMPNSLQINRAPTERPAALDPKRTSLSWRLGAGT